MCSSDLASSRAHPRNPRRRCRDEWRLRESGPDGASLESRQVREDRHPERSAATDLRSLNRLARWRIEEVHASDECLEGHVKEGHGGDPGRFKPPDDLHETFSLPLDAFPAPALLWRPVRDASGAIADLEVARADRKSTRLNSSHT